jgi:aspartyl-tRNA(Asn)/glutamyl-tRNA(Gln) amidotransferase subunit A
VKYGYRATAAKHESLKDMYSRSRDEGFGPEVKRRIMLGTYVLSAGYYDAFYLKALQVRTLLRRDYDQAFERADVIAMPTTPTPPFRLGEKTGDPLQMYLADVFTVSANLAGLPGISVPCGFSPDGLPIGFQLMGRMFDEATVLRVADAYEGSTDWHLRNPS